MNLIFGLCWFNSFDFIHSCTHLVSSCRVISSSFRFGVEASSTAQQSRSILHSTRHRPPPTKNTHKRYERKKYDFLASRMEQTWLELNFSVFPFRSMLFFGFLAVLLRQWWWWSSVYVHPQMSRDCFFFIFFVGRENFFSRSHENDPECHPHFSHHARRSNKPTTNDDKIQVLVCVKIEPGLDQHLVDEILSWRGGKIITKD